MTTMPLDRCPVELSQFLSTVLREGDTVVDVGAGVGYFTVLAGRIVGPSGRVYAFEPEAASYRRLREHLALSGLRNVQSFNVALGSVPGEAQMVRAADTGGSHRTEGTMLPVDVVVLDHLLMGLASGQGPRLIKVDAGGMGYEVVKGALRTILGHSVPFIVCAINRSALGQVGTSEMELRSFMGLIGYRAALLRLDGTGLQSLGQHEPCQADGVFNLVFQP
jgi:FkbM family methyltransferase